MDYKQEFETALRHAKELYDSGNALTQRQIEIIFPMLGKEYEEKRIKEAIINSIIRLDTRDGMFLNGITAEKAIDWVNSHKSEESIVDLFKKLNERFSSLSKEERKKTIQELKINSVKLKPIEPFSIEKNKWYYCIKDLYGAGKKQCSEGDVIEAKAGMYIMGIDEETAMTHFLPVSSFKPDPLLWSKEDEDIVAFYKADCENKIGDMPVYEVVENRLKFKDWLVNRISTIRPSEEYVELYRPLAGTDVQVAITNAIMRARGRKNGLILAFNGWFQLVTSHDKAAELLKKYEDYLNGISTKKFNTKG